MGAWILRFFLSAALASIGCHLSQTISSSGVSAALGIIGGLLLAGLVVLGERRLVDLPSKNVAGSLIGLLLGLVLAHLLSGAFLTNTSYDSDLVFSLHAALYSLCAYLGLCVGYREAEELQFAGLKLSSSPGSRNEHPKILDTSVIIDGRIADITETGFVEGPILIPQFVLNELQHIADSPDPIKRTRGKRGLEVLRHIQKQSNIVVKIIDTDYPAVREVDAKLIELAKEIHGKIFTNDSNLNKVAQLQGIAVLNVNELANALKPIVLPREEMNVKILKEGKETGQGVAYLDDGTMIVVDNGRRQIGRNADVIVTSVLQTPAGRMIFARLKEESTRERARETYFPLDSEF